MNLRTRLLLLGCCFLIFQLGTLYVLFESTLSPNISQLEQGIAERGLTRSMEVLQRELFHIEHTTQLMTSLPYVKMALTNPPLSDEKSLALLDTMSQQDINLLYILDNNNKVLWEKIIDLNTLEPYPSTNFLPSLWKGKPAFLKPASAQSFQAGIYNSFLGPILIVSGPILSSSPQKTIAGTLIIGRLITPEVIQLIQSLAFTDMKLWPLEGATLSKKHQEILKQLEQSDANFLVDKTDKSFQGYVSLPDLNQKANLLISTSQKRDFTHAIETSLLEIAMFLVLLQLIFMALLSWSIRHQLIVPVKELINRLNADIDDNRAIDLSRQGWNDINQLVQAISRFITHYRSTLAQQNTLAYRQGMYFARKELYQDLKALLDPLIEELNLIEKRLLSLPTDDLEWIIATSRVGAVQPNDLQELSERLQQINDKFRAFQKETRSRVNELRTKALRNAALLRARSHNLIPGPDTPSLPPLIPDEKKFMARS